MTRTTTSILTSRASARHQGAEYQGPAERLGGQLGRLVDRLGESALVLLQPVSLYEPLQSMSDARLRDIGLTRDRVMTEPQKPLWLG